jgi:hypothetical protein
MSRPSLVVHGHFYQPPRLDPFSGTMPADPTAEPAHDWNERISADCYRPNAELGNLGAISWDLGPTLAGWLEDGDPVAYRGFLDGDRGANGMAQPFHHPILPLASTADRRTEIRWGLRDFELRFGRRATGMWLPETAVDLVTLRLLADEGVGYTILAPWQVDGGPDLDTRRPVRIDLGDGRSMIAVLYDAGLSTAVSFDPTATVEADAFVRERLLPPFVDDDAGGLVVIATDGELYGHHQPFREHFLARLVGVTTPKDRGYDTPHLAEAVDQAVAIGIRDAVLRERTSWSCHHGIARWAGACPCVADGTWKGPLRVAFERLAAGIDAATEHLAGSLSGSPDPWDARDAYVDVVVGAISPEAFATERLGPSAAPEDAPILGDLMDAQRWRLAMFASCAWFWEIPDRVETASAIRAAIHAARLIDMLADTGLERRLLDDLSLVDGVTGTGRDLAASALEVVGAPLAAAEGAENPSARGLRATG